MEFSSGFRNFAFFEDSKVLGNSNVLIGAPNYRLPEITYARRIHPTGFLNCPFLNVALSVWASNRPLLSRNAPWVVFLGSSCSDTRAMGRFLDVVW